MNNKIMLHVQNIFEQTLGLWKADTLPQVDHLMIINGLDYRVTRIIWDMEDLTGNPFGAATVRVLVARCDGKDTYIGPDIVEATVLNG